MDNGWNLWVWLVSAVVRGYIYYRYPHNNYYFPPTPLVLTLFGGSIIPISLFIFKCFFGTFIHVYTPVEIKFAMGVNWNTSPGLRKNSKSSNNLYST